MKTAIRVAATIASSPSPDGHSQPRVGYSDPSGALPPYTLVSATAEKITRTTTSVASKAYCRRAETSIPRQQM
jgi:hypothetical protein